MEKDPNPSNGLMFMMWTTIMDMPPDMQRRFYEARCWPDDIDLIVWSPSGHEPPDISRHGFNSFREPLKQSTFYIDYHS